MMILLIVIGSLFVAFLIANMVYRKTPAYYNAHFATLKFSKEIPSNLGMVNFGSTYSMFAFNCYDSLHLNGYNFAIDGQCLEYDDILLHKYSDKIAEGAAVIICVSACVSYFHFELMKDKSRFYSFLKAREINHFSLVDCLRYYFPLKPWEIRRFLSAIMKRNTISDITEAYPKYVSSKYIEENMRSMVETWIHLFNLKDLKNKNTSAYNDKICELNSEKLRDMINFCISQNFKPVIVIPPFGRVLNDYFGDDFINSSLVKMINKAKGDRLVPVLDYMRNNIFQKDDSLFIDGGFRLSKRGSEQFVKILTNDLNSYGFNLNNQTIGKWT